ncbi:MAG: tRNA (adenosine(37)-N6)-threonylcarbamoyltransferase complex ATPase subunit type 1 TsaE [Pirellulales bacterium]|nr:tRNA (adenosine(37)-N6)-threonylcarbamoyltransferase complex ATPase subunit type 1 TsaE [Pirellulales bacterium]
MNPLIFEADNLEATDRLGRALAQALPPGTTVALRGTLGSGKTRLVQAVAESLGVPAGEVVSPTFVLIHEYQGARPIYHLDAYRIADDDEFLELGPDEYFDDPQGLTFVEWADRVERCLPRQRLDVDIDPTGSTSRRFTLRPVGQTLVDVLERLREVLH